MRSQLKFVSDLCSWALAASVARSSLLTKAIELLAQGLREGLPDEAPSEGSEVTV